MAPATWDPSRWDPFGVIAPGGAGGAWGALGAAGMGPDAILCDAKPEASIELCDAKSVSVPSCFTCYPSDTS
jgi:hypothetical protein